MKSAERKAERGVLEVLGRRTQIILSLTLIATVLAGILNYAGGGAVLTLVIAGIALALLAALVSTATEHLGERLGPGATGVLQSAIGNLPELFVAIFALRAGLLAVVQAALVGSILGNSLLVLGLAFFVGGIRHGTQRFNSEAPRMMGTLTMLAVAALIVRAHAITAGECIGKSNPRLSRARHPVHAQERGSGVAPHFECGRCAIVEGDDLLHRGRGSRAERRDLQRGRARGFDEFCRGRQSRSDGVTKKITS